MCVGNAMLSPKEVNVYFKSKIKVGLLSKRILGIILHSTSMESKKLNKKNVSTN